MPYVTLRLRLVRLWLRVGLVVYCRTYLYVTFTLRLRCWLRLVTFQVIFAVVDFVDSRCYPTLPTRLITFGYVTHLPHTPVAPLRLRLRLLLVITFVVPHLTFVYIRVYVDLRLRLRCCIPRCYVDFTLLRLITVSSRFYPTLRCCPLRLITLFDLRVVYRCALFVARSRVVTFTLLPHVTFVLRLLLLLPALLVTLICRIALRLRWLILLFGFVVRSAVARAFVTRCYVGYVVGCHVLTVTLLLLVVTFGYVCLLLRCYVTRYVYVVVDVVDLRLRPHSRTVTFTVVTFPLLRWVLFVVIPACCCCYVTLLRVTVVDFVVVVRYVVVRYAIC